MALVASLKFLKFLMVRPLALWTGSGGGRKPCIVDGGQAPNDPVNKGCGDECRVGKGGHGPGFMADLKGAQVSENRLGRRPVEWDILVSGRHKDRLGGSRGWRGQGRSGA